MWLISLRIALLRVETAFSDDFTGCVNLKAVFKSPSDTVVTSLIFYELASDFNY